MLAGLDLIAVVVGHVARGASARSHGVKLARCIPQAWAVHETTAGPCAPQVSTVKGLLPPIVPVAPKDYY